MRTRTTTSASPDTAAPADGETKPAGRRRLGTPATPKDPKAAEAFYADEAKRAEESEAASQEPRGSNPPTKLEDVRPGDIPRGMSAEDVVDGTAAKSLPVPEAKGNALFDDHVDDVEQRREAGRRARAAEAPKTADGLSMGKHQRIVDVLFDMPDPMEVYERVRRALTFGGRASSMGYGALVDALDEAETNAADAFQLLSDAKVTHDRFEMDAKVIAGALRSQALDDLYAQKAQLKADTKSAGKAITNDDIEAVIAAKFPDEYRDLESRRSRAKRTVAVLESLAELARERARDLRSMVAKTRDA